MEDVEWRGYKLSEMRVTFFYTNIDSQGEPRHAVISNDDLLYDPEMDNEDQKWVDRQRQSHRSHVVGGGEKAGRKKRKMPNSDALLDCPACLTTLCIDCQRFGNLQN